MSTQGGGCGPLLGLDCLHEAEQAAVAKLVHHTPDLVAGLVDLAKSEAAAPHRRTYMIWTSRVIRTWTSQITIVLPFSIANQSSLNMYYLSMDNEFEYDSLCADFRLLDHPIWQWFLNIVAR